MGVTGLIKFVEAATEQGQVDKLRGSTVAIDSYCLLHKGSYCCSEKLVQGIKTTAYVDYIMKYVKMLKDNRVNIIMVFDGMATASKAGTEKKRKQSRTQAKKRARELMIAGKTEEARKEFTKAVEIKHEHALALMEACRKENVDCITSMYEADAQLAYLNKIGLADYVISEDSDLILFGCTKIVFKLQLDGSCLLYDSKNLHKTLPISEERFSFEKFRRIAILSGCDYLDSIPGIGLAKASKFMLMTEETDMKRALPKMPRYLNMSDKITVTPEYIEGFLKAEATFKFMYVYDPLKRKMVRLNEFENEVEEIKYCSEAGRKIDEDLAYQIALGNINPRTLIEAAKFDPVQTVARFFNPQFSIWKSSVQEYKNKVTYEFKKTMQQYKITNFIPIHKADDEKVREFIQQENEVEKELGIYYLIDAYSSSDGQQPCSSKNKPASFPENGSEEIIHEQPSPSRNPFAKRAMPEQSADASKTSLIKNVIKPPKVFSRFFKKQERPAPIPRLEITDEMRARIKEYDEESRMQLEVKLAKNIKYYQMTKYSFKNETEEPPAEEFLIDKKKPITIEINDDDDDDENFNGYVEKGKLILASTSRGQGLKRKASSLKEIQSQSQSKLAKFGFVPGAK